VSKGESEVLSRILKLGEGQVALREAVSRLNGEVTQMSRRLDDLSAELRDLRSRIWWVIGIQISMWITIILAILIK
jgi:hypothetical protein